MKRALETVEIQAPAPVASKALSLFVRIVGTQLHIPLVVSSVAQQPLGKRKEESALILGLDAVRLSGFTR
jgi:hypothetical protein